MTPEEQQDRVRAAVAAVPGWGGVAVTAEPAIPILASPSWRGVDGWPWRVVDGDGRSLFVKVMDEDAAFYIDVATAFAAAGHASDLGVGPKVHLADVAAGVLVMEDLGAGWRVGTLDRLLDPAIVDAVVAARAKFQAAPALPRSVSVFEEIERFHDDARACGAELPADTGWLVSEMAVAAAAVAPVAAAPVPIHGDANVSNLMISDAGEVRLIDFDRATMADPLEDLGGFLTEAFDQDPERRDAFARATGGFEERAFNRARIYGIADDLRWGLIGAVVARRSLRETFEFYKFASWRFVRCRMGLRDPRFSEMLRRL
ncbi:phosphotransferase family protein [Oharaeibacter diazotrophicus]|uniref:Thiamine kinase-like enzyme n=1 Tax=Oharaeibacter diazotrophicus TaxID=1920512 RepID=A0A4R6RBR4_9HYPH|nr:phosphotransferase [Oharaeibacter diazotrophicus]TDP83509.1 thiamine kinase-like enzyme [Oharaeibacter diazotrophicus]BBE72342.1 phosphotransferase enzyme family protein [Pleomorphomonas sp. SM30]GLS79112.1 aminoglycoside phosphotransferase [Oharaeibacter diazotrophicus]